MTIRKVEIDEYDIAQKTKIEGKLTVRSRGDMIVLEIKDGNYCEVYWKDLQRAWDAVKEYP